MKVFACFGAVTEGSDLKKQMDFFPGIRGIIALPMDTTSFDFVYLDCDPGTLQPSACLYLRAGGTQDYAGIQADKLISAPCLSFIELDAEIRRLHAELDEVRARAKKKFYRAHAAAAGA
jgi:hypothetical protein